MNAPTCPKCGTVYNICKTCKKPHVTCPKCGWNAKTGQYVKSVAALAKQAITPQPVPQTKTTPPMQPSAMAKPATLAKETEKSKGKQATLSIP